MKAVARARDNELLVVVGVQPEDAQEVALLESVFRVARAAYHRVMMIGTGQSDTHSVAEDPTARRVLEESRRRSTEGMRAEAARQLGRLGVKTAHLDDPALLEMIATEVELLRFGRARSGAGVSQ